MLAAMESMITSLSAISAASGYSSSALNMFQLAEHFSCGLQLALAAGLPWM
jgi:hypothetical protein